MVAGLIEAFVAVWLLLYADLPVKEPQNCARTASELRSGMAHGDSVMGVGLFGAPGQTTMGDFVDEERAEAIQEPPPSAD